MSALRKLATASVSFSAAVFAANYILSPSSLPIAAVIAATLGTGLIFLRRKWLRGTIIVLFAFSAGLGAFYAQYLRCALPAKELEGQTAELSCTLLDYPTVYDDYCRVRVRIENGGARGLEALVFDSGMELAEAEPGQKMSFTGRLSAADVRYGEDYDYYNSRDIYLTASVKSGLILSEGKSGLCFIPARVNRAFTDLVGQLFPEDTRGFMKSLMLGDKTELYKDAALYTAMSRAGFMHVAAVSGMHIAFLVGLLQLLLGAGRKSSVFCIVLVWLFVLVTGSSPSALRAGFMQSFLLLAPVFRRENDPLTSLSFALALILLMNPYAAGSVSLQLSFTAMAGIMCLAGPITKALTGRLPRNLFRKPVGYLLGIVGVSLAVMAFTLPLMAIHFGYVSLLSPLANMLGLWAVSLCFCGGFAAAVLGALMAEAGAAAAWLVSWPARYIFLLAKTVSALPFAAVYLKSGFGGAWLLFCYLLFGLSLVSRAGRRIRLLLPAGLAALSLALTLLVPRACYRAAGAVFTALDVGQGQCLSVFSGDSTLMVDCGGTGSLDRAGETAGAYLCTAGRSKIDLLLLTHLHADHANGVETLLEMCPVEKIIMPENPNDEDGLLDEVCRAAARHGTEIEYLSTDKEIELGGIRLRLFAPGGAGDENERCLMALVSAGGYDMLVTGDGSKSAEQELIKNHDISGVELLIAGHHGSRYSCGGDFLRAIGGETAVVSTGYNTFGHPTYETLERLHAYGYTILRTDLNGTIEIRIGKDYGQEKQQR